MEFAKSFSIEEINQQVKEILDFPAFLNSPTLTRFLKFVVSETVLEKAAHIKEYTIAINVLNRRNDFNPNDDAVVRIHAGRLRRALNDYYLTKGIHDRIIIEIPKGGYIPQFYSVKEGKQNAPLMREQHRPKVNPVVIVFPFRTTHQSPDIDEFSLRIHEQLSAELSRFQDISVIGHYSIKMMEEIEHNILEAGRLLGADYIMSGAIQFSGQSTRVRINLLIAATGEYLMTQSFEKEIIFPCSFEIQDEIVQSVIGSVGGYYALINYEITRSSTEILNNSGIRAGIYSYYEYQRSYSLKNYNNALSTLQSVIKEYPNHAASWAVLGKLYLDGIGLGIRHADDILAEGYQCVLKSLKIDPLCQYGWHSLAWSHLFRGEKEACLHAARNCIQLNTNDSIMACGAGFMLICGGYFEEGFATMEKAIKLNPYYPWWINIGFSLYHLYKKEYTSALSWIEKMNSEETFWAVLLTSVSYSYLGKKEEAGKYLSRLLSLERETPGRMKKMLSIFLLSEELKINIIKGLEKTGINYYLIKSRNDDFAGHLPSLNLGEGEIIEKRLPLQNGLKFRPGIK